MSSSSVDGPHSWCISVGVKVSAVYMSKNCIRAHKAGLQRLGAVLCVFSAVWFRSQSNDTVMYLVWVPCVCHSHTAALQGMLRGCLRNQADSRLCLTSPESASATRSWCAKPFSSEQVSSLSQAAASENGRDSVNKGNN